jgi:hypothetical protein
LPETSIQQAYERVEGIRQSIEDMEFRIPTSPSPIRATMSFGVAGRESASQSTDEIIHNADTALYNSKLRGRNRVYAYTRDGYVNYKNHSVEEAALGNPQNIGSPFSQGVYKSG